MEQYAITVNRTVNKTAMGMLAVHEYFGMMTQGYDKAWPVVRCQLLDTALAYQAAAETIYAAKGYPPDEGYEAATRLVWYATRFEFSSYTKTTVNERKAVWVVDLIEVGAGVTQVVVTPGNLEPLIERLYKMSLDSLELWAEPYLAPPKQDEQAGEESPPKHQLPDKPPKLGADGYTWDDFFDWCYRQPRKVTVDEMAEMTGAGKRTVERHKSEYQAQYGDGAIPDAQSRFAPP